MEYVEEAKTLEDVTNKIENPAQNTPQEILELTLPSIVNNSMNGVKVYFATNFYKHKLQQALGLHLAFTQIEIMLVIDVKFAPNLKKGIFVNGSRLT